MNRGGVMAALALVASAGLATVAWTAGETTYNRASAVFPAGDSVHGKVLAASCLSCHGDVGAGATFGQPPFNAPKLRYQRPSTIFYALQDYRDGRRRSDIMQPMAEGLSDQDMRDLAVYLSAGPHRRRGADPEGPAMATSWAHAEVGAVCGLCHGEAGLGVMDGYPALAGQNKSYLEHALLAYRSGGRANPIMRHFAGTLTPDEVDRMATYFAAQPGLEFNP
jgi:cytochrome c553